MHKSYLILLVIVGLIILIVGGTFVGLTIANRIARQQALKNKSTPELFKEGLTFITQQEYGEAEGVLSEIASREPQNLDYLYQLALVKYNLKEFDEAIKIYQQIIATKETAFAWNNLGNCFREKKSYDKAKEAYQKAISLDAGFLAAYSNLALIYIDEGNKEEAVNILQKGIKANPRSTELKDILKNIGA